MKAILILKKKPYKSSLDLLGIIKGRYLERNLIFFEKDNKIILLHKPHSDKVMKIRAIKMLNNLKEMRRKTITKPFVRFTAL